MKKYQVKINNMELEIIQDDDGKFITPYLCIEDWGKFGTALKPSFEPIIVARKPFKGSLVDNVIEYGVGGINIDECRVETNEKMKSCKRGSGVFSETANGKITGWNKNDYNGDYQPNNLGRFPANTILTYDETDFDEVCGGFPDTKNITKTHIAKNSDNNVNFNASKEVNVIGYTDSGSASRYFMNCKYTGKDEEIWKQLLVNNEYDQKRYIYTPKASKKDRDEGLDVEVEEYILKENINENIKNDIKRLLNL